MRYAYCRKNYRIRDYCIRIPVSLIHNEPFRNLSPEACFLYGYLLDAQMLCGKTDEKGHLYFLLAKDALECLLHCQKKRASRILSELSEDGAGLITIKKASGKRLKVYAKDYRKPILPPGAGRKYET